MAYVQDMPRPAERTDDQVVRDVLAGDRDAYRLLVRRYGDVLYGHALRMAGNADDAADLVQRALVQGFKKLSSCRDTDRVGAWLFRILANLAKDHVRSPRRQDIRLDRLPDIPGGSEDPLVQTQLSEARNQLQTAMGRLTPEQREAFTLKHVEGRSYEEIAAVMDLSVAALKMRVHRARESLRGMLEEYR
jgi:RNA polymerase sigma-70 factor (ECF subfamily)